MSHEEAPERRVRFFGIHDLAVGWFVERVAELVERFDPEDSPTDIVDIIELYNVQQYLENDLLPRTYSDAARIRSKGRLPQIRSVVARFFSSIDDANCPKIIANIDHDYRADLIELLGRNNAFLRCRADAMLPALDKTGVLLGEMLASKKLVEAYGDAIRIRLLANSQNAEFLVRKHLERDARGETHFPASFTLADARQLLESYVDSPDANPNYLGLIETAQINPTTGIDAKLKLRAKRRKAEMTEKFFAENTGLRMGCEVGLSDTQDEAVQCILDESDGLVTRFTYSNRWLAQTCDYPSVLNNFQHLFQFADWQVLLTLPSYPSQLGVFERHMRTTGKTDYQVGAGFQAMDRSSLLQTRLYYDYLRTEDIDLERVLSWFFEDYVVQEFGAWGFSFTPSDRDSAYLQRVRHLFAEMESVTRQFSLFVENGELDRDLLAITSDAVRYRDVPSLVTGKYVYHSANNEIAAILHALFSDQSTLTYINEGKKADDAVSLLTEHQIAYEDLLDYQKPTIDFLIERGLLVNTGTRVRIVSADQVLILKSLFTSQAVSYYHLSDTARAQADAMVARGWLIRHTSLLSEAEASYFNYFLNKVEFSNGPELRNKYLHGAQANDEGEDRHFHTYITALRLTVALVIKMNDDFCLAADQRVSGPTNSV